MADASPTLLRRHLGRELRRLRELHRLTCEQAGEKLEWSAAKVSRMETGRVAVRPKDVGDLLDVYGLDDPEARAQLVQMARDARQKGWWESYADVVPSWFPNLVELEAEAVGIWVYQLAVVPGLLQTREYAVAVTGAVTSPDRVARVVDLRMKRQERLANADPPQFYAIIDEGVIRRPIGGPGVMARQLRRLADAASMGVSVQVVPFARQTRTPPVNSFYFFEFEAGLYNPIVYVEHSAGGLYLESEGEVAAYAHALGILRGAAADPRESQILIESAYQDITDKLRESE